MKRRREKLPIVRGAIQLLKIKMSLPINSGTNNNFPKWTKTRCSYSLGRAQRRVYKAVWYHHSGAMKNKAQVQSKQTVVLLTLRCLILNLRQTSLRFRPKKKNLSISNPIQLKWTKFLKTLATLSSTKLTMLSPKQSNKMSSQSQMLVISTTKTKSLKISTLLSKCYWISCWFSRGYYWFR